MFCSGQGKTDVKKFIKTLILNPGALKLSKMEDYRITRYMPRFIGISCIFHPRVVFTVQ